MKEVQPTNQERLIANILRAHGVVKAALFGSYARGEAGPRSDIDLLVGFPEGTTLFDVVNIQDDLERALGCKVDLVSQRHLSPRLEKRIEPDLKPLALNQ